MSVRQLHFSDLSHSDQVVLVIESVEGHTRTCVQALARQGLTLSALAICGTRGEGEAIRRAWEAAGNDRSGVDLVILCQSSAREEELMVEYMMHRSNQTQGRLIALFPPCQSQGWWAQVSGNLRQSKVRRLLSEMERVVVAEEIVASSGPSLR